jgi:hypothetical protein
MEINRHVENILRYIKDTYNGVGNLRNHVTKEKQMKDVIHDIVDKKLNLKR